MAVCGSPKKGARHANASQLAAPQGALGIAEASAAIQTEGDGGRESEGHGGRESEGKKMTKMTKK